VLKPYFATVSTALPAGGSTYIHKGDSGTTDTGTEYRAYVKTKPYTLGDLWSKFGLVACVMLGRAQSGATITIQMQRNFSIETRSVTASLAPEGSEPHVVVPVDNAYMSELQAVQLEYGDGSANDQEWSLDQFVFKIRLEEGSA
jgi:hypothetical protein